MNISQEGINLIKNFEGFRPLAYICPAGFLTIGFGHTIKQGEKLGSQLLNINSKISYQEALELLDSDIDISETIVRKRTIVPLTQGQFDALVSFVFNLGGRHFAHSTLLKKLNSGDYAGAANEFPKWVHIGKTKIPGLINRRAAELILWNNEIKDNKKTQIQRDPVRRGWFQVLLEKREKKIPGAKTT